MLRRAAKEGLGLAYRDGFRRALDDGADVVVQMDCDFSHDPAAIPSLVAALDVADLALGSRYVPGGGVVGWPLMRRAISKGGCLYARIVLGVTVHDFTGASRRGDRTTRVPARLLDRRARLRLSDPDDVRSRARRVSRPEVPIIFRDRVRGASKMHFGVMTEAAVMVPRLRFAARRR